MRFGPYELDSAGRELSKNGLRLKISGQPLQVLGLLLERPGAAVTRREFFERLWAVDTFVDFDHSLNTAIKRLRSALDDDPERPKYVETIPKYGYRFIGVVLHDGARIETLESLAAAPLETGGCAKSAPEGGYVFVAPAEVAPHVPASLQMSAQLDGEGPPFSHASAGIPGLESGPVSGKWRWATVAGLAALLAAGAGFISHRGPPVQAVLTQKDSVLLADFQNTTGEPVFDGALKNGLEIELGQSPFLKIVSRDREREILRLMGRSPEEPIRQGLAREVCQRASAKAVIGGSIARIGNSYIVAVEAQDCGDGHSLGHEQVEVASKDDVLRILGQVSAKLRKQLGESVASIRAFDLPLDEVTTVSLEALKAYSVGVDQLARGEESKAILLFEHAAELDPGFAMAYAQLGIEYNNLGESEKAAGYLRKAYALRDHLSEREKLFLTIRYDMVVVGDTDKATQTAEMWTQIYPRDWRPFNTLSARYQVSGEYEKAAVAAEEALRLQPDHYLPYANLARSYLALGRFDDARRVAESAQTRHRDSLDTHEVLFDLAFLHHDAPGMQREHLRGVASPRPNDMLSTEGFAQAASGHLKSALTIFRLSWEADNRSGNKEDEAYSMAGVAVLQADFGELRVAQSQAEQALKLGYGIDTEETAAQALALSGGGAHARLVANDLSNRFPLHVPFRLASLPTVFGSIEVKSGRPARAIQLLADAIPYDLCEFVSLGPVYIRGLAFLKLGRGREAAVEFQKIIDHPGVDVTSPRHALAHLGLARALALSGNRLASRIAYQQFLVLWADADPDIPELRSAKLEYARITSAAEAGK